MTRGTRLTTYEAQVTTASIAVKTLTLRDKQVTLAVFRQLEEEDAVDWATMTPRGEMWGRVNYHPDNACRGDHRHIVWQKGDELRRATIRLDRPLKDVARCRYGVVRKTIAALTGMVMDWEVSLAAHGQGHQESPAMDTLWVVGTDTIAPLISAAAQDVVRQWESVRAPAPLELEVEDEDEERRAEEVFAAAMDAYNAATWEVRKTVDYPEEIDTPRKRNAVLQRRHRTASIRHEGAREALATLDQRIDGYRQEGWASLDDVRQEISQQAMVLVGLQKAWEDVCLQVLSLDQLFIAV